ncbi:MAG: protocatechuate 3,4-dioxygenase subunit alpha [Alphaproteobacteria bacterium]|nr:protocatechuate 3,4-dioxygenase subunit alpha [Alphaproteobacteria bacterium]
MSGATPFQTVGPFFRFGLIFDGCNLPVGAGDGARIAIEGTVRDGDGAPVPDALLETWQADAAGRYRHPEDGRAAPSDRPFDGFRRAATDPEGRFRLETVKPGPVPGPPNRLQAPHLVVGVFARGLLTRLVTRIYFEDEAANDQDPVLELVPTGRVPTLVAKRIAEGRYRFDIVLQGKDETVFLAP